MVGRQQIPKPALGPEVLATALMLSVACHAWPATAPPDPEKLWQNEPEKLCVELGRVVRMKPTEKERHRAHHDAVIAILKRHRFYSEEDYASIQARLPRVGMHVCALHAAMGAANRANITHNARGEQMQLIYQRRGIYVYTDAYHVTSWQQQAN